MLPHHPDPPLHPSATGLRPRVVVHLNPNAGLEAGDHAWQSPCPGPHIGRTIRLAFAVPIGRSD